jgi:coniferyl-aldehyde dehydrogenase
MLKPSEFTPATTTALAKMIAATFPVDHVALVTGDAEVGRAFTSLPFDHLLFTGSTTVGRHVMLAAAEHLTPVTLELGGKCPVLIAPDAKLKHVAAEVAYGKLINCGQSCTAPDYVLVPRDRMEAFAEAFRKAALRFYPDGAASADYTSILRPPHAERLVRLLTEARARGVRVHEVFPEAGAQRLGPALLFDPPDDLAVMQEEIFGPLLPLKPYDSLDEALAYVNARPRPLALYLFSRDQRVIERVLARTVSGGAVINDTMVQVACESLPFGGVGASGMGRYHGREGFDTFSHLKPVFARRRRGFAAMLRPPTTRMHEWFRRLTLR